MGASRPLSSSVNRGDHGVPAPTVLNSNAAVRTGKYDPQSAPTATRGVFDRAKKKKSVSVTLSLAVVWCQTTDSGWRLNDGGWRLNDGGWRLNDGGWRLNDGG